MLALLLLLLLLLFVLFLLLLLLVVVVVVVGDVERYLRLQLEQRREEVHIEVSILREAIYEKEEHSPSILAHSHRSISNSARR